MSVRSANRHGIKSERAAAFDEAKRLVQGIYARHGAGCCWHVVLDDHNTGRLSIDFCARYAANNEGGECGGPECADLARLAKVLSCTQFGKLAACK